MTAAAKFPRGRSLIPSGVTVLGVICTFVAVVVYPHWLAVVLLVVGQLADVIDGWAARSLDACTEFGASLDRRADVVVTHVLGVTFLGWWWLVPAPAVLVAQVLAEECRVKWSGRALATACICAHWGLSW